jgi:L-amino acid N-acyltransferase YncA
MIRTAHTADIDVVVAIYNQAIADGFQTAHTAQVTLEDKAGWFNDHLDAMHPIFVYVADGQVAGWLSVSSYRSGRAALRFTAEISYYVDAAHRNKGIGAQLMAYSINACRQMGYHTLLAIILDVNTPSIELTRKFGFKEWGHLPGIASFDGQECGHVYYGLKL